MTYGDNGGAIRIALTNLLHQQRLQYRLSDDPRRITNRTAEQREEYGAQIRRYRQAVLVWCHEATIAADPYLGANEFFDHHNSRSDGPYDFFRKALDRALDASTASVPTADELNTIQDIELVETWRKIGEAAALGKNDFKAGLGHGMLSAAQCHTVMKDVAAITQGLVILDHRYANIPGWEKLKNGGWLGWTALAAGLEASIDPPDYAVDHRGWRPPLKFVRGPARPGLLGVLQAEQNLLVRLTNGIAPINLRIAVAAQMAASADLAARSSNVELQASWQTRAETYDLLHKALRDVGSGHANHGASAAREASNVIDRIGSLPVDAKPDDRMLAAFDKRFTRVDTRIAELIEDGLRENTILRRTQLPRLDLDSPTLVKPVRERLAPIEHLGDSELLTIVGTRLRPRTMPTAPLPDAARCRADLFSAVVTEASARTSHVGHSSASGAGSRGRSL